jgi:hypothetical protein
MPAFTGVLYPNEIFASLYNLIISVQCFADNIAGTNSRLVDMARTDGGMYGDQKVYVATDALYSHPWGADEEAENLLQINRPKDPEPQYIRLDVFRQIRVTVDSYLSKRSWGDEGAFSMFMSVVKGWLDDTKRIYDSTTYNVYFGTTETDIGKQTQTVALTAATTESDNRMNAQKIAQHIADLIVEMEDVSRDFNDYAFIRSYDKSDIKIVWNSKWVNQITKVDVPSLYHKDIFEDMSLSLPPKYFGTILDASQTVETADGTYRAAREFIDDNNNHYFAGEALKPGTYDAGDVYMVDEDIICKIVIKLPPYMSSFSVGTSFFNPRSLTESNFLTFSHNTLDYLKNYPLITVKAEIS